MNILIINGPNLNLLGIREPEIYGNETLEELMMWLEKSPISSGISFKFFQSNHEGVIIDTLHDHRNLVDAIIINAGALSHYSYAIRDAITAINIPTIEVHLSNINQRESFRSNLVLSDVCFDTISGKGKQGYLDAVKKLKGIL